MSDLRSVPAGLRDKLAEFLGREPHPSAAGRDVYHIADPRLPQYRFEWHPKKRIVYLVRLGAVPLTGEAMAHHVETHGDAIRAVQTWARGFHEGRTPDLKKPHLEL
ncbi:MAG: hypothetical protein U1E23_14775 [Reyranellaceae bacterium]